MKYLKYYLFVFICFFAFGFKNVFAETHVYNGTLELKMITGNYQDGVQDGTAVYPEWITGNFPNGNYLIVPGSSSLNYNGYYFVKYFNMYFDSDTTFDVGKTYAIDIDFAYGSYITWTNYFGWSNMIADRTLNFCASGSSPTDLSQCSVVWNPTNDSTSSRMTLLFRPNTTSTHLGISVGSLQNSRFVFWNRLGDPQGFKVNTVTITSTQNSGGTPSQDFSQVIEELENNGRKLDDINDNLDNVNDNLEDLNDNLTDETEPNVDSFFNGLNVNDSNSPVTDLITMPLTLLNAYINGISGSCSRYSFGYLLGTELYLPCINPVDLLGSTLWGIIDLLICIFLCYEIAMLCISIYESLTSLDDGFYSLYKPKHAATEYQPKHGGGN